MIKKGDRVVVRIPLNEMKFYKGDNDVIPHGEHYGFNGKAGVLLGSFTATHCWVKLDCFQSQKDDSKDWKKRKTRYISCPNKYLFPE
jgi:hypothetical protein